MHKKKLRLDMKKMVLASDDSASDRLWVRLKSEEEEEVVVVALRTF